MMFKGINAAYPCILFDLLTYGKEVSPRGMKTKELIGYKFCILNSRRNTLVSGIRKLSHKYMVAEWLWIYFGRNDTASLVPFNRHVSEFSDDGEYFSGAYGPVIKDQWPYVQRTIRQDPVTRQAIISIWRPRPGPSKDVPCTVSLQFLPRDGRLHMMVSMRSNDAWLGLPYDIFTFTQLQMQMATSLGLTPGEYHHSVGSLHLYEQHFDRAQQLFDNATDVDKKREVRASVELLETSPTVVLPIHMEEAYLRLAIDAQRPEDSRLIDDPEEFSSSISTDAEVQAYIGALLGYRMGRFKQIRALEENHGA